MKINIRTKRKSGVTAKFSRNRRNKQAERNFDTRRRHKSRAAAKHIRNRRNRRVRRKLKTDWANLVNLNNLQLNLEQTTHFPHSPTDSDQNLS